MATNLQQFELSETMLERLRKNKFAPSKFMRALRSSTYSSRTLAEKAGVTQRTVQRFRKQLRTTNNWSQY